MPLLLKLEYVVSADLLAGKAVGQIWHPAHHSIIASWVRLARQAYKKAEHENELKTFDFSSHLASRHMNHSVIYINGSMW